MRLRGQAESSNPQERSTPTVGGTREIVDETPTSLQRWQREPGLYASGPSGLESINGLPSSSLGAGVKEMKTMHPRKEVRENGL